MQRVLDPAQIEAFAQGPRTIPRARLPDPQTVFANRAARLRQLSVGHAVGDYLRLMAALVDSQQRALGRWLDERKMDGAPATTAAPIAAADRVRLARDHGMPLLQASDSPRDARWRDILLALCAEVAALPDFPQPVATVCAGIRARSADELEQQAGLVLSAGDPSGRIDTRTAPFIMAALQVYWVGLVCSLSPQLVSQHVTEVSVPGVCPVCGTLPVASIVRSDKTSQGYRYLHCALCATEWHMVRVKCSQCLSTEGIHYHSIARPDGSAPAAVRAEACDGCHTYRKICYQEYDTGVEPVADDLGSLALDLAMAEEGFHRGSGHPLLWQGAAP
ncbi:MAG TPA: formate dehydrogenase accessory protein FdhE [Steroidobacteraceae bacterium]|nr:formate dehydrogenase accessory protein FdhE [Steroidobacteraceae bacterium]